MKKDEKIVKSLPTKTDALHYFKRPMNIINELIEKNLQLKKLSSNLLNPLKLLAKLFIKKKKKLLVFSTKPQKNNKKKIEKERKRGKRVSSFNIARHFLHCLQQW